ncbi:MAG: helix-turn-helix transcriptional regulator [Bacteriovoracales bacterium]|nr:helix-turn-helix transcriptional regulator [Bacteriovoracales bacterium]
MTIDKLLENIEDEYGAMSFGDTLKAWRECEEMTQAQFSKKLSMSPSSLGDLESGRRIPTPSRVVRIAKKLGIGEAPLILLSLRDYLRSHGLEYQIDLKKSA